LAALVPALASASAAAASAALLSFPEVSSQQRDWEGRIFNFLLTVIFFASLEMPDISLVVGNVRHFRAVDRKKGDVIVEFVEKVRSLESL
jgi:hypothetical protein